MSGGYTSAHVHMYMHMTRHGRMAKAWAHEQWGVANASCLMLMPMPMPTPMSMPTVWPRHGRMSGGARSVLKRASRDGLKFECYLTELWVEEGLKRRGKRRRPRCKETKACRACEEKGAAAEVWKRPRCEEDGRSRRGPAGRRPVERMHFMSRNTAPHSTGT